MRYVFHRYSSTMASVYDSLLSLSLLVAVIGPVPVSAQGNHAVSAALQTIFSPHRSPAHRTMGLSQRTFLDLVEQSKRKLEVAFLIDATDSMESALNDVRTALSQWMGDLEL
jgi:hypothetical protein